MSTFFSFHQQICFINSESVSVISGLSQNFAPKAFLARDQDTCIEKTMTEVSHPRLGITSVKMDKDFLILVNLQ